MRYFKKPKDKFKIGNTDKIVEYDPKNHDIESFEKRFILRHTALVDFNKLGFTVRSHVSLRVERQDKSKLQNFLLKSVHVNSLYKINNGFDFLVEAIFKEIKELDEFIELLESKFNIIDHREHFIINDIKRESFLAEPNLVYSK